VRRERVGPWLSTANAVLLYVGQQSA